MEGIVKPTSILENTDERILRIEEGMPKGILKNPDSLNEKKIKNLPDLMIFPKEKMTSF